MELDDDTILRRLREIVVAPPPVAFPTGITFSVAWPPLANYASAGGVDASRPPFWSLAYVHDGDRPDVAAQVTAVCAAGLRFCDYRMRSASAEMLLAALRILVQECCALKAMHLSLRGALRDTIGSWVPGKMQFAVDNMLAVVDGEGAYHGAEPIVGWQTDDDELQRARARFNALLERVLHWRTNITTGVKIRGALLETYRNHGDIMDSWEVVLTDPLAAGGNINRVGFHDGHTKYESLVEEVETADQTTRILSYLPTIKIELGTPRTTDILASAKKNANIQKYTRALIQHYVALRSLLASCHMRSDNSPWHGIPDMVQLDESHSNPRSIIIFKAAWYVAVFADKLWSLLSQYEKKGQIEPGWMGERKNKARLRKVLRKMTQVAVLTQADAWREEKRYAQLGEGETKYW